MLHKKMISDDADQLLINKLIKLIVMYVFQADLTDWWQQPHRGCGKVQRTRVRDQVDSDIYILGKAAARKIS